MQEMPFRRRKNSNIYGGMSQHPLQECVITLANRLPPFKIPGYVPGADVQGSWFCNTCLGKSLCQLCFLNDAVTNGEIVQDVQWIECSGCRNWFHTICVGAKADALQTWFCSVCSH